jgi:glycosyltransferase involved in cell wall biosynthesis
VRVLAIVHKYPPTHNAGAEVMLHAMLRDLARRGHRPLVTYPLAPKHPTELDGIPIVATPPGDGALVRAAQASDVIVTHLDVTPRAMRVAAQAHRPLVHLVHNDQQLSRHAVTLERATLVVFNSQWLAHAYRGWQGPTVIVRPPVWVADYELEAELNFAIRFVGGAVTLINLTQAKGARRFYDLAAAYPARAFLGIKGAYGTQVTPRRRLPNVELVEHLPASAMRDRVYRRTRVLVVPSSYESWGRVAIEAAAAGIPVIAHPTPGLLEALGDAGLFADRNRGRDWAAHLDALDVADYYRERADLGRARARELELIVAADLDAFALRLEALVGAYARREHPTELEDPMAILSSASITGHRCPICGARNCACGPSSSSDGIIVRREGPRGPVAVYRTATGDWRLNAYQARQRGLLPDGPNLPRPVRRLLTAADVNVADVEVIYTAATDDARATYLTEVNLRRPRALGRDHPALLEALRTGVAVADTEGLDELIPDVEAPPITKRVGEVLSWADSDAGRIRSALEAERAGKARPTLIDELERRLAGLDLEEA